MHQLLFLVGLCFVTISRISCQNGTEVQQSFDLLEEGRRLIQLTNATNVVLVFGVSGTGKTTFVQWIAGNDYELTSVETSPDSGKYLIKDKKGKIGMSSASTTLFPELHTEAPTGTPFYDFPGFSDTRNPSYDIATSFFIKSVLEHVKNVKLIFLTSHYSVEKGKDRFGFPGLLKHIHEMITDIEKFRESIALVVSKVEPVFTIKQEKLVIQSDSAVINEIASYLNEFIDDKRQDLKRSDISVEKRDFIRNAIKIVEIFLTKKNEEYTRIMLFRAPNVEGSIGENKMFSEGKLIVKNVIKNNLVSMSATRDDFKFTISDNTKLEIVYLATAINDRITDSISEIAASIKKHLVDFIDPIREKINAGNLNNLSLSEASEFSVRTENGRKILSEAVEYFKHLKRIGGMNKQLEIYLNALKIEFKSSVKENLDKFCEYFEFCQRFHENNLRIPSPDWAIFFQSLSVYLLESKQSIIAESTILADKINSQVSFDVESIANVIKANFTHDVSRMTEIILMLNNSPNYVKVDRLKAKAFHEKLRISQKSITQLVESVKNMNSPNSLFSLISNTLSSMSLQLPHDLLSKLLEKSQVLNILEKVSDKNFSSSLGQWSKTFEMVLTSLQMPKTSQIRFAKEKITLHIELLLKTMFEKFKDFVDDKSFQLGIDTIDEDLKRWQSLFAENFLMPGEKITFEKLISKFDSSLSNLAVSDASISFCLNSLNNNEKNLGFLKSLTGDNSDVMVESSWKAHIIDFNKHITSTISFNEFVLALYKVLSSFKVQKDVSRYDVIDFSDWGNQGSAQGIHVDKSNFKVFMAKIQDFDIWSAHNVSQIIPSDSQLIVLKNVFENTLKKRIIPQCAEAPGSKITLKANFIRFSEFLDSDGKLKGCGWKNVSSIEIYALDKLFIDEDLIAIGYQVELSIIAPLWQVVGDRKIILDGKDGHPLPKAANGAYPGANGENGSAGRPGGSAGVFFGVAGMFIGGKNLEISTKGGKGGPGQSGGDGAKGQDGATPPDIETCSSSDYKDLEFEVDTCLRCEKLKVFKNDAKPGGNAGLCGVGGQGGFFGEIKIIRLKESTPPFELAVQGNRGEHGSGGQAGIGGARIIRVIECSASIGKNGLIVGGSALGGAAVGYGVGAAVGKFGGPIGVVAGAAVGAGIGAGVGSIVGLSGSTAGVLIAPAMNYVKNHIEKGASAENGLMSTICSSDIPENPLPARHVPNKNFVLREFRTYLIKNYRTRFTALVARRIYDLIGKNSEVRELQNVFELIEDHKMIESYCMERHTDIIPFYESHLTNIDSYAAKPKASEESSEVRKVLSYLYTASLTQISNFRKKRESDLVIDIGGYLDVVLKNVGNLSALHDKIRFEALVKTLQERFKQEIDMKIRDAQDMISKSVIPGIKFIASQFDAQISKLVNKTIALQNATIDRKAELKEEKKQLVKKKIFNSIVNVFGMITKAIPILGSAGEIAGTVSSVLSNLIQFKLPPTKVTEKYQQLGESALELSNSIKNDMKSIREVTNGIEDIEETLKKLVNFENRVYEKLLPLIEKMGKDLTSTASSLSSKSSTFLDVASWKVQETLKDTRLEIQEFTRGFTIEMSVLRLGEKLEAVMTVLIKIYDRIQNYQEQQKLGDYLAHLSSASVAATDVTSPKLRSAFLDLRSTIQSNIILNQYDLALNAFKQWIFPFAEVFLSDFQLPQSLVTNKTEIHDLASDASRKIETMRTKIETYMTKIESFDKHIHLAQFNSSSAVMKPFYMWKNDDHRDMITQLLEGKTVLVKADVTESPAGKDAIKFNFIEMSFKAREPEVQAEVNKKLMGYGIVLTHMGSSNYRYNDQFISITSPSLSLSYSFEKSNGKPTHYNNVYSKLLSGDIILSPYSWWKISLTEDPNKPGAFEELSEFSDKVDLILEGSGSFVNSGETNFDVRNNYEIDDSIPLGSLPSQTLVETLLSIEIRPEE